MARLEQRVGVRLVNRTTWSLSLTDDGAALVERCRRAFAEIEEAEEVLGRSRLEPRGRLRVDLPVAFGRARVLPRLGAFRERHPGVTLSVTLNDRVVDPVEDGVDVAFRFGARREDSRLIARTLRRTALVTCAAPSYLAARGEPGSPDELARHDCLSFVYPGAGRAADWLFASGGERRRQRVDGPLSCNNVEGLLAAAEGGLGIVQLADYLTDDAVANGRLVRVLARWAAPGAELAIAYPHREHLSPTVRAFVEFAVEEFGSPGRLAAAKAVEA